MLKIAVYGKGGIGKSTISSNLSVALAERGYKVMQIGCDPKADSTIQLHQGRAVASILDIIRAKGDKAGLDELVTEGSKGVLCAEAGGPTPGMGCAGRGIITAFEALEERNAFEVYKPDVVIYDVLGDVVCGGFAMPIREGYADKVFIVTSGENMAIYAAANIATAVKSFEARGYASLGGILLNRRGVKREQEKVEELAEDMKGKAEIVKVDVDQEGDLAMKFGIMSVPTMIVFKNGEAVKQISGYQPKTQLANILNQLL